MVQTIELSSLGVGGGEEVAAQESSELRGDASNFVNIVIYHYIAMMIITNSKYIILLLFNGI